MRLISFLSSEKPKLGIVVDEGKSVIELSLLTPDLPQTMNDFIKLGPIGIDKISAAMNSAENITKLNFADLKLLAPIPAPSVS